MASRPVFVAGNGKTSVFGQKNVEFIWNSGMAAVQKKKNVVALHQAAKKYGYADLLEVSTKSENEIGRRLSAFNLQVGVEGFRAPIECIYQGSKVFEKGGPYNELYNEEPLAAKKYFQDKKLGKIVSFSVGERRFSSEPYNAFYDWLFIRALSEHIGFVVEKVFCYDGYTDIEFNPQKSINTQARSIACMKGLYALNVLDEAANDYEKFCEFVGRKRKLI